MNELLIRLLLSWLRVTCRDPSMPALRLAVGVGDWGLCVAAVRYRALLW